MDAPIQARSHSKGILNWRDWLITIPLEIFLLALSWFVASAAHRVWHLGFFVDVVIFYTTLMALTIVTIRIIHVAFPPVDGEFRFDEKTQTIYIWRLVSFLSMTNLFLNYQCSLLPTPVRKFLSRLLGAKIGKGLISIGGLIVDPYLITIEEEALIGHEALLLPNRITAVSLILGRITIRRGAVVGARSILMPGVTVGEHAMVKAMSVVAENTTIAPYEVWGGIPAKKMGELAPLPKDFPRPFSGWRDMVISPLVQTLLLAAAAYAAWVLSGLFGFEIFGGVMLFYGFVVLLSLLLLKLIRTVFPFQAGRYSFREHPWACYRWSLHGLLCILNLFLHFQNGLMSPPLRRFFYRLLGAKIDKQGLLSMSGISQDPYMLDIKKGVVVCHDALVLGHVITQEELILSPVKLEKNAVLGIRSMLMPGVTMGEGACVEPLSLVTSGTTIGPGEIWFGIPARKVGETEQAQKTADEDNGFTTDRKDIFLTAATKLGILAATGLVLASLSGLWWGDGFAFLLAFHITSVLISLMTLWLLRRCFQFKPGIYDQRTDPATVRRWRLYGFIGITNLSLYYFNGLLPPHLRKIFLRLIGLRAHVSDLFSIGGLILDPYMVKIGKNSIVGLDTVISPVQITNNSVILKSIELGDRVMVGHRCVILPGVVIGDGSIIESMSLIAPNTVVPPYEIWGGIPAAKIGDLERASPAFAAP